MDTGNTLVITDSMEYEMSKYEELPEDASETIRIVRIGNYDVCPCIGAHVASTAEIGSFRITSTSYNDTSFRIVYKLGEKEK